MLMLHVPPPVFEQFEFFANLYHNIDHLVHIQRPVDFVITCECSTCKW